MLTWIGPDDVQALAMVTNWIGPDDVQALAMVTNRLIGRAMPALSPTAPSLRAVSCVTLRKSREIVNRFSHRGLRVRYVYTEKAT